MANASSYSYVPLGNDGVSRIRILTILPSIGADDIRCILHAADLDQVTKDQAYETLSYTWGDEPPDCQIHIQDDVSGAFKFNVRPNLYQALNAFRLADDVRNLWIDAICINQEDDEEKKRQIPLMRRIYEGARQTMIWLGPGTKESQPAMGLARDLYNAWTRCAGNIPKIGSFDTNALKQHGLPPLFSFNYIHLLTMLEQPWFGRAWIVQEVTVSKQSVLCWGNERLDWQHLVTAIDFALRAELPFVLHPAMNRFLPLAEEGARYRANGCKLHSTLLRHRPCAATDPRDKVYAFLGLMEKSPDAVVPIHIDYKEDIASCYTMVARSIAIHDQSLDILSMPATPLHSEIKSLPSWVPDWSLAIGIKLRQIFGGEVPSLANVEQVGKWKAQTFSASRNTVYHPKRSAIFTSLIIEGHLWDRIVAVGPPYESNHIPNVDLKMDSKAVVTMLTEVGKTVSSVFRTKSVLMQWEDSAGLSPSSGLTGQYPTGEELVDAFWQTLMLGNVAPEDDKAQLRQEYIAFSRLRRPSSFLDKYKLKNLQTVASTAKSMVTSVVKQDAPARFAGRSSWIPFRRFIRTSLGFMGLCSGDVEAGDQIWLARGSKVPLVLRPGGVSGEWRLIGDAYIHGIMYGEGFDELKCHDISLC